MDAEGQAARPSLRGLPSLLARLEALAPALLWVALALWVAAIFAASVYKYETLGQGGDQVDFEQAIWNTTQGRVMEDSRFDFTGSIFGMDWMPMLLLFVPLYALAPSAHILFFSQIAASALGAVPLYWLARDRFGSPVAGLGAGLLYLLYPTLLHTALNPFQLRLFALTLLLFAFYYFERGNWALFFALASVAMLARTDVALVVAMFGLYGLITRRQWMYVVPPLLLGLGYFALSTFVIVPSFLYAAPAGLECDGTMKSWPCGGNPILAYYGHLGRTGPEILSYLVTHPLDVAQLVFTWPKMWYIVSLLVPLAFLPIFAPKPLVLGLPILALNLLSLRSAQYDYEHHYSLLIIPALMVAAIYGAHNLYVFVRRRTKDEGRRTKESERTLRANPKSFVLRPSSFVQGGALALVCWALVMQAPYKNPAVSALLNPEPPRRVRAAHDLIRMVPPEAKVAASSKVGPRLLPRRYIYNFPPAPYSPYNFGPHRSEQYVDLDYVLVDTGASALQVKENQELTGGKSGLQLLRELPEWKLASAQEGFELWRRVASDD